MKREVLELSELNEKGVKVARLAGNRDLNEKAVKAKMKSMREESHNLCDDINKRK